MTWDTETIRQARIEMYDAYRNPPTMKIIEELLKIKGEPVIASAVDRLEEMMVEIAQLRLKRPLSHRGRS